MASPLTPARRRNAARRTLVALLAAGGVALGPLPASAEPQPSTSQEAADLNAARSHELEVLTERFNEAREEMAATRRAAERAAADRTAGLSRASDAPTVTGVPAVPPSPSRRRPSDAAEPLAGDRSRRTDRGPIAPSG